MNNRPIHFEIQADDAERAKKFYENALGSNGGQIQSWQGKKNGMRWSLRKANNPRPGSDGFYQAWVAGSKPTLETRILILKK